MKIKIIFVESPYSELQQTHNDSEKIIVIKDPYTITKNDEGRQIIDKEGNPITYELYCVDLKNIIKATLRAEKLEELSDCDEITIEGSKEPPNFEALYSILAKSKIPLSSPCKMTIKNNLFYGSLYVNSLINFVKSAQKKQPNLLFNITLDEEGGSKLRAHDIAKLASIKGVAFFPHQNSPALLSPFLDDHSLKTPKTAQNLRRKTQDDFALEIKRPYSFSSPGYFFKSAQAHKASPQSLLMNFFSQSHQQQSDYTCGPATLKMIADYYIAMGKRPFCGEATIQTSVWNHLITITEANLAASVKTTEEVGSSIEDLREGLNTLGLAVIDDYKGFSEKDHIEIELIDYKKLLLEKIEQVLILGIPVILNMRAKDDIGHYEVAIGIDEQDNVILADPAGSLDGLIEFEQVPKKTFIARWKNMSGEFHGRFLIVPPNNASAQKIESILEDIPHYFNGEAQGGASQILKL
ncbi:MAG: C39 family peptidase [Tatlockia sp.]|nr:C39 family peptidase [Tatlockia sp.]